MRRLYDRRESPREPAPVSLVRAWWDVAGPALARAARPAGVVEGVLEVVVGDRGWHRQVEELRDILLSRLRRRRGCEDLSGIRVILELSSREGREDRRESPPGDTPAAPEEILRAAQAIDDPDLGRRWCGAIGRQLQRRSAEKPR
jgi:hypothetical protein